MHGSPLMSVKYGGGGQVRFFVLISEGKKKRKKFDSSDFDNISLSAVLPN
jgi:hypothetical protein